MIRSVFILLMIVIFSSCSGDYQGVTPYSPVRVYPNPFKDYLNVEISSSKDWQLIFLDGKGNSIKDTSGTSNFSGTFDFSSNNDESIVVQTTIGTDVYVTQVLKGANK